MTEKEKEMCVWFNPNGNCRRFWITGELKAADPNDWLCNTAAESSQE